MYKPKCLKKFLENHSVVYLRKYLKNNNLEKKEIKLIEDYIKKQMEENKKMSSLMLKSPLLILACVQLIKERKTKGKIKIDTNIRHIQDPCEVILMMNKILNEAENKKKVKLLEGFYE